MKEYKLVCAYIEIKSYAEYSYQYELVNTEYSSY